MTVEPNRAEAPRVQGGPEAGRTGPAANRRWPGLRDDAVVLLAVAALGTAAPILGLFVIPTVDCAGERGGFDPTSRAWCGAFAILLYAPLSALVAGGLAGALGPTVGRFLGGLVGLALGCVVAILAMGESLAENLWVALAFVTPVFAIGYGIVGALRALAARSARTRPRSEAAACFDRGLAYDDQGEFELAIAALDRSIELNPNDPEAYNLRGIVHDEQGDLEAAIADLDRAIALDPRYASAYNNRGNAHAGQGHDELAMADYTRAIDLDPNHAPAYSNRGAVHWAQGDLELARVDLNRAIELDPTAAWAYLRRGRVHADQGERDLATADFDQGLALATDPEVVERLEAGRQAVLSSAAPAPHRA